MDKKNFDEKELLFIRQNAGKYTVGKLAEIFHCSHDDIKGVCKTLGVSPAREQKWTDAEVEYLRANHLVLSAKEMANVLGRSVKSVQKKMIHMELCSNKPAPEQFLSVWKEKQETYLRNGFGKKPMNELVEMIGKSEKSIRRKATLLGLNEDRRRNWNRKEELFVEDHYLTHTIEWMAKKLKRPKSSVARHLERMKLNRYDAVFSLGYIARCFDYDRTAVKRSWINNHGMPAQQIVKGKGVMYDVDPEQFWNWAVKNEDVIPWERYHIGMLPDEPENLKEIISKYII